MNVSPSADSGAVGRWLARVCTWAEAVAILMLLVMTALIILQVGGRNLLNQGWPWAEELARYAGLGLVYLTAPLLLLRDKHIQVDIVSARIPGLAGRWLRVVNEALVLAFCGLFLWGGWAFLKKAGQFSTPALGIPNSVYYMPALLGMLLLAMVSLHRLLRLMAALKSGAHADGATP
jgi:TRAP-type transport system small permease protein